MQRLKKANSTEKTNDANFGYKKSSQAKSDIVVLSRKLHMYCSHGNKLMQEGQ